MIFYLTSKENANLLDSVADEVGVTVSKAIEQKNLNRMIVHDVSNFSHISYFVIDLSAISDDEDDVLTAIDAFRSMYGSRIIVVACKNTSSKLISSLIEQGIYNVVTAHDPIGIQTQLKLCFSVIGMSKDDIDTAFYGYETSSEVVETHASKNPENPVIKQPLLNIQPPAINTPKTVLRRKTERLKQQITIAICGTERRIGTTHQALLITKFLQTVGFKACYLEANNHRSIGQLEGVYDVAKDSKTTGLLSLEGVDMYYGYIFPEVAAKGYDFFVFDFGSFEEIPADIFLTKDIKIIVGGSKAWELSSYERLYQGLSGYKDLNCILNFVPESEQKNMIQLLNHYKKRVHFSDYAPYLFEKGVNHHVYSKLFQNFVEVRLTNKKKTLALNGVCKSKIDKVNQLDVNARSEMEACISSSISASMSLPLTRRLSFISCNENFGSINSASYYANFFVTVTRLFLSTTFPSTSIIAFVTLSSVSLSSYRLTVIL